mmetsp:Transcript_123088/g.359371  ORF Transcript_123088/g.359371 Transcript_123088/m.359371 type:complete len:201 (+) Transcript_123088:694-1296(+)
MLVDIHEIEILIEMLLPGHPALDDLVGKLTFQIHEMPEHVIVGLSGKEDLAGEYLKQACTRSKDVGWWPILSTKANLGSPIKSAHQVRSRLNLRELHGTAQVAYLDEVMACSDEDVVRLDVCMKDAAPVDVLQAHEQLLGVCPNGAQRHALVLCVLLQRDAKIVPHALKDQAQVSSVAEGSEQADYVLLVAPVGAVEPFQ